MNLETTSIQMHQNQNGGSEIRRYSVEEPIEVFVAEHLQAPPGNPQNILSGDTVTLNSNVKVEDGSVWGIGTECVVDLIAPTPTAHFASIVRIDGAKSTVHVALINKTNSKK